MYAESFGIQNPSAAIEAAATWVQWAQAGILAGSTDNDAAIRYNLNQFWEAKNQYYPLADPVERGQLERLDTYAHGFWNALETAKIYAATPNYWQFWKKYWIGGTPDRPEAMDAATAAAAAAAGEEEAAKRAAAANPSNAAFGSGFAALGRANAANVSGDLAAASGVWKQTGVEPLGVPLWAWVAGAAALGLLYVTRK